MSDHVDDLKRAEKYFDVAADVRKFEIGLFWQRSLFFWGFVGAAFVAYVKLLDAPKGSPDWPPIAIACFGFVCGFAWTLVNRGNKYWQEAWEQKVERKELDVLGDRLFERKEAAKKNFPTVRALRYSVSKLVIALSDFTIIVWAILITISLPWTRVSAQCLPWEFVLPAGAFLYAAYMAVVCHSKTEDS